MGSVTNPRKMKRKRDNTGQCGLFRRHMKSESNRISGGGPERSDESRCFQERASDCWVCTGMWVPGALAGPWYRALWESHPGRSGDKRSWDTSAMDCRQLSQRFSWGGKGRQEMWGMTAGSENSSHHPWLHGKEDPVWGLLGWFSSTSSL